MSDSIAGVYRNFSLMLIFRAGFIDILLWSIRAFPQRDTILLWALAGIGIFEELVLGTLWRFTKETPAWLPCLAAAAFLLDGGIGGAAFCLLMISSHPIVPMLLQFLTFEGFAFWDFIGAVTGFLLSTVILVIGWGIDHQTLSQLILWSGSSLMMGFLPISVMSRPHSSPHSPVEHSSRPDETLTPRQNEIYELWRSGLSQNEIAERLMIEIGTVKTHIHQIYKKFNIHHRKDLK